MSVAGARIIESLKEAVAGDFAAVTIAGQRWVRVTTTDDELIAAISKTLREHMENEGWRIGGVTEGRLREKIHNAATAIAGIAAQRT